MTIKSEISVQEKANVKNAPRNELSVEIKEAEQKVQLIKLKKRILEGERGLASEKRSRLDEYISWGFSKFTGIGALSIGGIEFLDPDILELVLKEPLAVAGGGLGLLVGKEVISKFTKILNALEK